MIRQALSLFFLLVLTLPLRAGECQRDAVFLRGDWGQARFSVEVADTEAARNQGLMFRSDLPSSAGMLFIYPQPRRASFWMKNTLIPLDMLFVDASGIVQRIHHMAVPHDPTPIEGGDGILVVLEINGGLARAMGITQGTQLRHPAFSANHVAWPC